MTVAAAVAGRQRVSRQRVSQGVEPRTLTAGPDIGHGRLAGTLVHRLIQRHGITTEALDDATLRASIDRLVRPDERPEAGDPVALVSQVTAAYRALCQRPEVREIYLAGDPVHEVPFTFVDGGHLVRGTIDCLVLAGDRVTVLEFKTGGRRVEHDAQSEYYRRAAQAVFPDAVVDARVIYASPAEA